MISDIRKNAETGDFSYSLILEKREKLEDIIPLFSFLVFREPRFISNLPPFSAAFRKCVVPIYDGSAPPPGAVHLNHTDINFMNPVLVINSFGFHILFPFQSFYRLRSPFFSSCLTSPFLHTKHPEILTVYVDRTVSQKQGR